MSKNTESNILDIYLKMKTFLRLLKKRRTFILIFVMTFASIGATMGFFSKTKYRSRSTLILEESKKGFGGFDALNTLASQFGMGSSISVEAEKIIKVFSSRAVVEKLFFTPINRDSTILLINELARTEFGGKDFYFGIYFSSRENLNRQQLNALKSAYRIFISKCLKVQMSPEGIIEVSVLLNNEDNAILVNKLIVKEIEYFYLNGLSSKNKKKTEIIDAKLDSINSELKMAEERYIRFKDANHYVISARGMVDEMHLRRDIEILHAMSLEGIKRAEMNKMSVEFMDSFLRVIDKPEYPADAEKKGTVLYAVIFALLGVFLSVLYLFVTSFLKDLSNQSKALLSNE